MELICPRCDYEFEARIWEPDLCPKCNNAYNFDEICNEDYSFCDVIVEWENYK